VWEGLGVHSSWRKQSEAAAAAAAAAVEHNVIGIEPGSPRRDLLPLAAATMWHFRFVNQINVDHSRAEHMALCAWELNVFQRAGTDTY